MNKMTSTEKEIGELLSDFKKLWDGYQEGHYQSMRDINILAKKIRDEKCFDNFLLSELTPERLSIYKIALILANSSQ